MTTTVFDQIQLRRGTAAVWSAANPILAQGEPGLETDTNLIKFGDGVTAWTSLAYSIGGCKTSAQLLASLSGVTGSGNLVFGTGPTLSAPLLHANINSQGGTTYTLALTDDSGVITTSNSAPVSVLIPTDATLNIPVGTQIAVVQGGAGAVTVAAVTPGTTIVTSSALVSASPVTRTQGSVLILIKTGANTWFIDGDFTTALPVAAFNRNAVLNADFFLNQRAFTSNTTTGAFNFDRWFQQNSGGTCTVTPQTFTPGAAPIGGVFEGRNFVQLVTATQVAAGDYAILTQRIEDVTKFAGQQITISFFAKVAIASSIGVEIQQNFGTGGSPSATVSTPIAAKAITTSWARYSVTVTVPSITGKTLGTTANTSYLELNLWISSGATNATRASSIGIQNTTFSIFGVKLEAGVTATNFAIAHDSIGAELSACQRFYYRNSAALLSGYANTTTVAFANIDVPVNMRATPTLGTDGTAGNYNITYAGSLSTACSVVPTLNGGGNGQNVQLSFTVASGLTAGQGVTCKATTYLEFIAEL